MTLRRHFFLRFLTFAVVLIVILGAGAAAAALAVERAWLATTLRQETALIAAALAAGTRPPLLPGTRYQIFPDPSCRRRITLGAAASRLIGTATWPLAGHASANCLSVQRTLPTLSSAHRAGIWWLGGSVAAALLLGAGMSWELADLLSRPVQAAAAAVVRLGQPGAADPVPEDGPVELAALAAAANRLARELEQARSAQRMWIATAAHALRTPLTTLRLALDRAGRWADADAAAALAHAEELIADLLAVETLASAPPPESVDLDRLTRTVIDGWDNTITRKALDLRLDLHPARVWAPAGLLRHVLDGLVGNACKYTPAGGAVSVRLEAGTSLVRWTVEDTGIGIPAADLPHIGEPFFRAANARAVAPGSGLGLSLARDFATRYGGRLTLTPRPGGGTVVELALPVADPGQPSLGLPSAQR
jgi:signal transduction histidine kinase